MRYESTTGLHDSDVDEPAGRVHEVLASRDRGLRAWCLSVRQQVEDRPGPAAAQYLPGAGRRDVRGVPAHRLTCLEEDGPPADPGPGHRPAPALEEAVAQGHLLLIDSTAVPTGNRPGAGRQVEKASYSGKHHLQPLNPGRRHHRRDPGGRLKTRYQAHATTAPPWGTCGWAKVLEGADWIADTAYTTTDPTTPQAQHILTALTPHTQT